MSIIHCLFNNGLVSGTCQRPWAREDEKQRLSSSEASQYEKGKGNRCLKQIQCQKKKKKERNQAMQINDSVSHEITKMKVSTTIDEHLLGEEERNI